MFASGLFDLRSGREMNEAVADIDRTTPEHALPLRFAPGRSRADLVDLAHEGLLSPWPRRISAAHRFWPSCPDFAGTASNGKPVLIGLHRVIRLLAVEDAFEGREMPLRRGKPEVKGIVAHFLLGLFHYRFRKLLQRLPGPHRVDLNLGGALDVIELVIGIGDGFAHRG